MLSYIKAQNSSLRLSPIFQRILRSGFVPDILKSVVKNVFIRIFAYGGICHTDGRRKRRMNGCAREGKQTLWRIDCAGVAIDIRRGMPGARRECCAYLREYRKRSCRLHADVIWCYLLLHAWLTMPLINMGWTGYAYNVRVIILRSKYTLLFANYFARKS